MPADQQTARTRVRDALGQAAFAEAWAAGDALSVDEPLEFGLAVVTELQQVLAMGTVATRRGP